MTYLRNDLITVSVFLFILPLFVWGVAIENGVQSKPDIICLQDRMQVVINTFKPFHGHVYVKGQYQKTGCHLDLTRTQSYDTNVIFDLAYRGCYVQRERSIQPPGISYTGTIVVQFHPFFLTKVDRAYRLTCFYTEFSKYVSSNLHVSMIPTTALSASTQMPRCTYNVLANSLDGPVARFARIGEKVYHKWSCEEGIHGILVHSCVARDGGGAEYPLLDERGCTLDPIALGNLEYSPDLSMAWAEVHVFKFADQMLVNFQCRISLCLKQDQNCEGVTPPNCSEHGAVEGPNAVTHPDKRVHIVPGDTSPQYDAGRSVRPPFTSPALLPPGIGPLPSYGYPTPPPFADSGPYDPHAEGPVPVPYDPRTLKDSPIENSETDETEEETKEEKAENPVDMNGKLVKKSRIERDAPPPLPVQVTHVTPSPTTTISMASITPTVSTSPMTSSMPNTLPQAEALHAIPSSSNSVLDPDMPQTVDVTAEEMFVFNLDDDFPQPFSKSNPNGSSSVDVSKSKVPPFVFQGTLQLSENDVCLPKLALAQLIIAFFFIFCSILTVVVVCQRRYYHNKQTNSKQTRYSTR